ncbi:MAG: hypothetical protein H0W83_15680 [Planctomycetes bacterium]|nr:hypothetical protein [Planctomycetota bacterium]
MLRRASIGTFTAVSVLATAACVSHVARIAPAVEAAPAEYPAMVIVGSEVSDPNQEYLIRRSLPIDAPFTAWKRDESGVLFRCDGRVRTPLPWWQRFPADAFADFLPMHLEAAAGSQIVYAPVPIHDQAVLTQHAERDGFAHAHAAP